ncbi:Gp85 [Mycolicibacterium fortuitum subsp. acetamidolyticum]|uniref:Gp85 n=1 Tax=Mycolicibacterium fortuitum subsp. acetamidolyticum TaxID=144550 RepID=A0A117IF40_MYCFO|nr:hypothetical protein [Mycolicibacterium fortuitum]MCV7139778.1 hypothetical protein [Mycolicibacterium fortuitum]GAT03505.1 Gp85 [Mycolicibacterium fortuitum subsp. acetamidolyticum]
MKLQKPPTTPAEHITRAKEERAGGDHTAAQTLALIAIAERLSEIVELLLPVEIAVDAAREPLVNWPTNR